MSVLRIPKHRASIELVTTDGQTYALDVFLADFARTHDGPERLSDLLAGPGAFVPAVQVGGSALVCMNLEHVVLVRAAREVDAGGAEDHNLPTEHEVDVFLAGGGQLRGLASYLQPPERSRLSDHLNDPHPFLRLLEGERYVFINKRAIVRVVPAGA